jgi:NADH-quinone oxidoreductase subunit K
MTAMAGEAGLLLALGCGLYAVGFVGLLVRRTIVFQLIALEVMLTGPALVVIAAGAVEGAAAGQALFVIILTLTAAEVSVGLALYLRIRRLSGTTDSDAVSKLHG